MINLKHRRALSEVISTTILVAAMLVIVTAVMGFALNLFSTQTQNAEFSQGQTAMVSLAQGIDSILPSPGSSTFVRFNTRTGGPVWISSFDTMKISISSQNKTYYNSGPIPVNAFRYAGGSLVAFEGFQWLRAGNFTGTNTPPGNSQTLIIENNSAPIDWVYLSHDNGRTWITLDVRRISVVNLGTFVISNGYKVNGTDLAGNQCYVPNQQVIDIIQVTYINLTRGSFSGSNSLIASVFNAGLSVTNLPPIPSPNISGSNYNVTIKTSLSSGAFDAINVTIPDQLSTNVLVQTSSSSCNLSSKTVSLPVSTVISIVVANIDLSVSGG